MESYTLTKLIETMMMKISLLAGRPSNQRVPLALAGFAFIVLGLASGAGRAADAYECPEALVAAVAGQHEDEAITSACRVWPADPSQSIVVLSRMSAPPQGPGFPDQGDYDLEVRLAETASGHLLSRYFQQKALSSDAWILEPSVIDTAPYRLTPNLRAFGVSIRHVSSSRPNPSAESALILFVREGMTLRPVLSGLITHKNAGEWDTRCSGAFSSTERTVSIATTSHNGFADLIVVSQDESRADKKKGGNCISTLRKRTREQKLLIYDGSHYVVPKDWQSPDAAAIGLPLSP